MKRLVTIILLAVVAVPLVAAVAELPAPGSPEKPFRTHVAQRYLERGAEEAGTANIVKAVLLDYRLFDTFGEAAVIFTALAGVLGVLPALKRRPVHADRPDAAPQEQTTRYVVSRTVPAILVFGTYLVLAGHDSPGGAFQGGVVLGAGLIALSLAAGSDRAQALLPEHVAPWLQGAAMLAFLAFALGGPAFGAVVFDYPPASAVPWAKEWLKLLIEAGIGLASATIIATVFWSMEGSS